MLNELRTSIDCLTTFDDESDKGLLLIDDDASSRQRLAKSLERKGFVVTAVESLRDGIAQACAMGPKFVVAELRLGDGNGLDIVTQILKGRSDARIVMLTAYGNIATAVAAIKAGAVDYLPKPADADAVARALLADGEGWPAPPENPMSADRVKWEHIQRVFYQYDCNVSETARRLGMHRRTLQRILSKHAPRDNQSILPNAEVIERHLA
ncbi:MAG TPA: ActR/PrrA/RegA family redox response regulator transcription factor [Alphaproteobacteria bacterium]|nr:ActR/PrrA/RegA family redox response regulator transcription factor [Alphaproteobacteria bacterium]